jgi:hypothetical protein
MGRAEGPALLPVQAPEWQLEAVLAPEPGFFAAAGDEDLALSPAQAFEQDREVRAVLRRQMALDDPGDPRDRLEVVPDDKNAVGLERLDQGLEFLRARGRHRLGPKESLDQSVDDVLAVANVLKSKPEDPFPQPRGRSEPVQEPAGERGLPHAPEPMDEDPRRPPPQGPLER